jgi:hypothetical protein
MLRLKHLCDGGTPPAYFASKVNYVTARKAANRSKHAILGGDGYDV